jgi:hypothetical protein
MTRSKQQVRQSFSGADRIRGRTEFQGVIRRGEKISWKGLSLFVRRGPGTSRRLGVAVSSRVGGAVARNRTKRRLREHFRLNRGRSSPTIINAAYNRFQFWDGREPSLEAQALGPERQARLDFLDDHDRGEPLRGDGHGFLGSIGRNRGCGRDDD